MAYHYQIVNMLIDPVGQGAKKLSVHRTIVTPQGAELPDIVWPSLKKLCSPVNVQITPLAQGMAPFTTKAYPYKERTLKGSRYGVLFSENLMKLKGKPFLGWKNAVSRAERRKLPRFSGFPEYLMPLKTSLMITDEPRKQVRLINVSMNGLGVEFDGEVNGKIGAGIFMGECIRVVMEKKGVPGLRLVTQIESHESSLVELSCEVRRVLEVMKADHILYRLGLRLKHRDFESESAWKEWVSQISEKIQPAQE